MQPSRSNKYRTAAIVLQRGRDLLVDSLADEVLDQGADLVDNTFLFNEFLETQGTRLHFLTLVMAQLEQSAEAFDELAAARPILPVPAEAPAKKRKPRAKKMPQKASTEGTSDER